MLVASVVVSALLALVTFASGGNKIVRNKTFVTQLTGLGVPEKYIPVLGTLLVAGGAGLVLGIWWAPLGIAAAAALALYFLGAVVTHLRAGDTKGVVPVVVLTLLSAAALVLRVLSL
ncbi:DoxX family protein [Antribacter sp. KLBMP9083]|uniref:DoxX family protein n=1 Tax=Antribacter soli TaxID=2910976 RepID=A0AA41UAW0_9MICO|nr:DoxX family protein [Antribacter soli]MCF4120524.1 DoxX family protein [Antribacter soli]